MLRNVLLATVVVATLAAFRCSGGDANHGFTYSHRCDVANASFDWENAGLTVYEDEYQECPIPIARASTFRHLIAKVRGDNTMIGDYLLYNVFSDVSEKMIPGSPQSYFYNYGALGTEKETEINDFYPAGSAADIYRTSGQDELRMIVDPIEGTNYYMAASFMLAWAVCQGQACV